LGVSSGTGRTTSPVTAPSLPRLHSISMGLREVSNDAVRWYTLNGATSSTRSSMARRSGPRRVTARPAKLARSATLPKVCRISGENRSHSFWYWLP
jgi:hypothetical protein